MATLLSSGALGNTLKYTDDSGGVLSIITANIISYGDLGDNYIEITTAKEDMKLKLDSPAAVNAAITLLDLKF